MNMPSSELTTPTKSPWSETNHFSRSRFIVKRLKRLRSKTKSLHEETDNSFSYISTDEPLSLPYSNGFGVSMDSLSFDNEEIFQCCSPSMKYADEELLEELSKLETESSSPSSPDAAMDQVEEEASVDLETFEDRILEILKDLSYPRLLEEIEDALPEDLSLKTILFCPYTILSFRTSLRLHRIMPLSHKCVEPKVLNCKTIPKINFKSEFDRLGRELVIQKQTLEQAKKAQAISSLHRFHYEEYKEAEKTLLLVRIKLEAIRKELEKLQKLYTEGDNQVNLSNIAKIREISVTVEKPSWTSYNYICIGVERDNVKSTPLESASEFGLTQFSVPLVFNHLQANFTITVYVYGISVKDHKLKIPMRQDLLPFSPKRPTSYVTTSTGFTQMGKMVLDFSHVNYNELKFVVKSQGLEQSVQLCVRCDVCMETLLEGFLDVMRVAQDEDGLGFSAWERKWYRLTALGFYGYNYPSQQASEIISDYIPLNHCLSRRAEPEQLFECARPYTFSFILYENNNIVKLLCAAETREAMFEWCEKLNVALKTTKAWTTTEV